MATNSASTRMNTSATTNSSTFSRNARRISGNASLNRWALKKASLTASHPGEFITATTTTVKNTTVLIRAIRTLRAPSRPRPPPRMRERRSPSPGVTGSPVEVLLRDDRERDVLQVLLLEHVERPVRGERADGPVHAPHQRVALLEHQAVVLLSTDRGELPDHDAVLGLTDQHVHERIRCVDQVSVDLLGVERRDDVVRVVVHGRLLGRLDVVEDVAVAGRADLRAQLVVLEVGERLGRRDRRA